MTTIAIDDRNTTSATLKRFFFIIVTPSSDHNCLVNFYIWTVDMSDLTGQSMLNDICLGGCGNERRATLSAKTITCVGARTENWQRA